jgi:CdiI immunity protein
MRAECLKYPALCHLVQAYFHQDWRCEGATAQAVLERYREGTAVDVRARVVDEIDQIFADELSEDRLDHLLANLELDYDPEADGLSNVGWLRLVRGELADAHQRAD